jgi:hypothetical protein
MRALGESPQDPLFDPNVLEARPFAGARLELREASAARPPPWRFGSKRRVCLLGRISPVLSSTPETGYEEPVADRESIGSGGTMVGESPRLGAFRVYGGYSGT